jgi:hypothetical protein
VHGHCKIAVAVNDQIVAADHCVTAAQRQLHTAASKVKDVRVLNKLLATSVINTHHNT